MEMYGPFNSRNLRQQFGPWERRGRASWASGVFLVFVLITMTQCKATLSPSLSYDVIAQKRYQISMFKRSDRPQYEFKLYNGYYLSRGDKFRLLVTPEQDLYLYVFSFSSTGKARLLFPSANISMDNDLKEGEQYSVPPDDYFRVIEGVGTETILLASVANNHGNVERITSEMHSATLSVPNGSNQSEAVVGLLNNHFDSVESFTFQRKDE